VPSLPAINSLHSGAADAAAGVRAKFAHAGGDQLTALAVLDGYLSTERRRRAQWAADNYVSTRCGEFTGQQHSAAGAVLYAMLCER
jgi:hypothetical protein